MKIPAHELGQLERQWVFVIQEPTQRGTGVVLFNIDEVVRVSLVTTLLKDAREILGVLPTRLL